MNLCANCLHDDQGINRIPVGEQEGSQRDPWWHYLMLCNYCADALVKGDLGDFNARYSNRIVIER